MEKCIFCAIASHESPAEIAYEDNEIISFQDIDPKAKVHLLIIPKRHISSVIELKDEDAILMGKIIIAAKKLADQKGLSDDGYRLCFNAGRHSGQIVDHLHLHLMGGGPLGEMVD